ncbi:MAG TPA: hypothetical protein VH538_08415 [Gaiellaceae bacterium]
MATKLALLLRRRGTLVFALVVLAAVLGTVHATNVHAGGFGFWDGPA